MNSTIAPTPEKSKKENETNSFSTGKSPNEKTMEELQTQNEELVQLLQRTQADFQNFQKRVAKENAQIELRGKAMAFKEVLEFLDSFDAAVTHVEDEHKKGLMGLRAQLLKILYRNGIVPIESVGKKIDPHFHEGLMRGNDPMQGDEIILEEFQKGYLFHGDVLRPAKVKVNQLSENNNQNNENSGGKKL